MPKQNPEWEKQLNEREPYEERPSLDPEALSPYKEKIKNLEKDLRVLDDFLLLHFDAKTKPKREDFIEIFRNLDTIAQPNIDPVAAALSNNLLEIILVYLASRLQYRPIVIGEILNELYHKGKDEALEQVLEYVKTLHLGIVENKKKVLWQLVEHIGVKKTAAIFKEQDEIKEQAYQDFLDYLSLELRPEDKKWLESGDPEAVKAARSTFDHWYEINKVKYILNRIKIRGEVEELSEKLDDATAYKIIEKHLSTNPQEIFELMENQARISSG